MLNLNNIRSIAKKELRSFVDNPTAYIILIVFLSLWEFLYFRQVFLVGEASLRILFDLLPWLLLLFIPALTMGTIASEKSEGTLELLLTHPIKDIELILGKFLGVLFFVTTAFLFILPIAATFSGYGPLDWGVVVGQFMGGVFLASILIALGIFISSLLSSQITALLVSAAASFFLIVSGSDLVTANVPLSLVPVFERLSISSHFESLSRGVVDVRDVWYFLSGCVIFLSLAYLELLKRRFGNRKTLYRNWQIGIALFIGIAILTNIIGSRIPGRIDLTRDQTYTLSATTKKTLTSLNDVVTITVFASTALPAQFQPILRDTKDLLRDYATFSRGNVLVTYKNPSGDTGSAQEANQMGVKEIQFNVVGQEEFQVKTGYLGMAIAFAGKHETLPFIQDTKDLEYQLTSSIIKLTTKDKKKVAFLSGSGEKSLFTEYQSLDTELEKQFMLDSVTPTGAESEIATGAAALVVAGPTSKITDKTRAAIQKFIDSGGSAMFLVDPVTISPQTLTATPNTDSFADFLKDFGVTINQDLVYDTRAHETVRLGNGLINYFLPYPFWPRVAANSSSPITAKIDSLVIPWPSSISLDEGKLKEKGWTATKLLITTKYGGKQTGNFTVSPDAKLSQDNLGEQTISVSLEKEAGGKKTRVIIVADSDFLGDQFIQNSPSNVSFGIGALSYLTQETSLADIKLKTSGAGKLVFQNPAQIALVKYGNLALAIFLPLGFGIYRLMRRRSFAQLTYRKSL